MRLGFDDEENYRAAYTNLMNYQATLPDTSTDGSGLVAQGPALSIATGSQNSLPIILGIVAIGILFFASKK